LQPPFAGDVTAGEVEMTRMSQIGWGWVEKEQLDFVNVIQGQVLCWYKLSWIC